MKINKKYRGVIFSCIAAVFISVPIAFFMVLMNYGFRAGFMMAFFKSSLVGTAISVPLANIFIPLAEKIVNLVVEK